MTAEGVYAPQQDSRLLIETLMRSTPLAGRRAVDLCTGSGVVAIAAAELGAAEVSAWDISPRAVRCAAANAEAAGVSVRVRLGSTEDALRYGPYEVVMCNPPYVPTPADSATECIDPRTGCALAWDAGEDGRAFLDPLCAAAPRLLAGGGTMLVVHSEFAGAEQTVDSLQCAGMSSDIVASQLIPFGPVLSARAQWLEETGRLQPGRREERLVVVRARNG
ncbi:MAG TPA: HemK2/MTQ2 family protein methyltransferase [Mycobacterium sp.]|nr:HemK2/MTQ2 family protein methyltransferase [Mycobacterium sp.]